MPHLVYGGGHWAVAMEVEYTTNCNVTDWTMDKLCGKIYSIAPHKASDG